MKRITVIAALLALAVPLTANGATAGWKKVAQASDSSSYYASAMFSTKVNGALKAKLAYAGTSRMEIDGSVLCTGRDFSFESRDFAFMSKKGIRSIPMPIRRGNCSYTISASIDDGGAINMALYVLR